MAKLHKLLPLIICCLLPTFPVACARVSEMANTSTDYDASLSHDGLQREYRIHLPPAYRAGGKKMPVVVYLHGGGGSPKSAYKDGLDKAADTLGFILAMPKATRVMWGPLASRWNGGTWKGGHCCGSADDIGFISKMIDQLVSHLAVDPRRIYATGISNGGLMANRVACELADKIAAVATVAPAAVPQSCAPSRPIPVMNIHGTGDPCNPFDGSVPTGLCRKADYKRMSPRETVDFWRRVNRCTGEPAVTTRGTLTFARYACPNGAEVEFCTVEGMGHTWPSGSQYFSARLVGPVSHEISTADIWAFFQRHALR